MLLNFFVVFFEGLLDVVLKFFVVVVWVILLEELVWV